MRFEDGRIDQFVNSEKEVPASYRYDLIRKFRDRASGMAGVAFKYFKNEIKGDDSEEIYSNDEQRAYVERAKDIAQHGYQDNVGDGDLEDGSSGKKPSFIPLIAIIIFIIFAVGGLILGGALYVVMAFFLVFSFLGFYSAIKGNGRATTFYGGTNAESSRTAGIMIGSIGLVLLIPLFFARSIGIAALLILMTTLIFAVVGLVLAVGFIRSLGGRKRKYTQEVSANCVGYSRIIGSSSGSGSHRRGNKMRFQTSPILEYEYQGKEYRGIYDRMIDGLNADVDLGPVTIFIDPDHPEDIYHKSTSVQVKGLIGAIVCIALAVMLGSYYPSVPKIPMPANSSQNIFALFSGDVKEQESMFKSLVGFFSSQEKYQIPAEITDEIVDKVSEEYGYGGCTWYYEIAKIDRIDETGDRDYNIVFEDEAFPQIGKRGKHDDIGDTRMVFYTVNEYEKNGEKAISKDVFLDLQPDEHTYAGSHGAYEGE